MAAKENHPKHSNSTQVQQWFAQARKTLDEYEEIATTCMDIEDELVTMSNIDLEDETESLYGVLRDKVREVQAIDREMLVDTLMERMDIITEKLANKASR